ncbi:hypothetical protein THRCLA_05666 [Thraustotheca clavata]|uniref:Vacuolar protein 8 n=1 Tax=Thraustotheca clavata TaxID=74557 RepID=A0A1V9ZVA1_9STRA|nr:hypothetical protein THRCLA_05666 [Thraustotheca clavata]
MRSGIEEVQIHCAAALCGMACERGHHRHMWKEGTVSDFIVNSLLRINSESTKEVCARVLFNVLSHEDCRSYFIKEGVLYALIKLARLESLEIRILCVAALYNLSCDSGMIASLMEANVPHVVSKMCEGEFRHEDSRRKLSACLTNMALAPGQEIKHMEGGILNAVLVLCEHFDPECMKYGASVLCSVSMEAQNCDGLASTAAMELLLRMMSSKDKEQCTYAVNAVCNVSCNSALHDKIEGVETLCSIMHAVGEANEDEEIILTCAKTICNMTYHSKHRSTIMKFHFIRTFIRVFATRPIYLSVAGICARILATLSEDPSLTEAMVGEGAVHLLRMTVVDASPETIIYCIVSLCRLSRGGHSGTRILDDGLFDILAAAIPLEYDNIQGPRMTTDMTERCSMILRTLSTYTMCIPQMIDDHRLMPMIKALAHQKDKETCKNCVMLVHNITAARNRTFQKSVRTGGVIRLLITLAKIGSSEEAQICAVALAHINCELSEADRNEIEAYEHGVVATMIGMLDMDPPAMQKAEKISTTLPPLLHWAPPTKDWIFFFGENKANATCTKAIPVSWVVQDAPIDESKLTPKEPISFISQLPQQLCEFSPVIKDELYGTFQILQVSTEKSHLKVSARHSHMSLTAVLKTVDSFPHEESTPLVTDILDEPLELTLDEESNLKEDSIRKSTIPKKPSQRSSSKTNKGSRRTPSMQNTKKGGVCNKVINCRRIKMSHRLSQNARHTQELLQDLEHDKELDVLRVYLARYNLFPRKRDPKTAPIRAEELRDLVKHWKLHRQRNFWKSHTTKEELVRTLYKYINTKILPSEVKPPCALASTTSGVLPARPTTPNNAESKKASFDRKNSYHTMSTNVQAMKVKLFHRNGNFSLEQYSGDLFSQRGEYDDGMIYLSRLGSSIETPLTMTIEPPSKVPTSTPPKTPRPSTVPAHTPHSHHGSTIDARLELIDEDSTSRDVRMKRECACSLYQLSLQVGHERGIVLEGCVPALVRLSLFDDNEVKKYCAAALVNLTCDTTLIAKMVEDGLLGGLMELSKLQHEDVRRNASLGLCRGSYERQGQLRLMQEGSVPAMISMLNSNDYETKEACIKALINIASFTGAAVSETVVHTLVKLANSRTDLACVQFIAETLANLSILTGSRIEAVEDGILDPILQICSLFPTIEIKKSIAIALCNFSGIDSNHADLCQLHVLQCLDMLLDTPDESIRELSSVAVANLSCQPESIRSIIDSNIAIRLIQIGYTQNNLIQENISLALANLAAAEDNDRIFLTRHGVVLLILQLLRSGSILTKQYAVATLCGLMENETSRNEIVQCDAIEVIISLTNTPKICDYCAVCLLNFSAHSDLSTYLLDPRAIMTLLSLFTQEDRELSKFELKEPLVNLSKVQESCLNCLYNLSFYPSSRDFLINEGAVSSLATVFRKPCKQLELNKRCIAIICNYSFSNDMERQHRILYDDGLKLVKRLMSNTTSKEILLCASSILCNLSLLAIDQPNSPLLNMLMDLSHTAYPDISLNCAMAFSKLSSHSEHGDILAKCIELPPTLTVMMRSGIEEVQVHCATALCGLAAERGSRSHNNGKHLWREGTISDFIVNSLLRINSDSTKEICARVLFNVLTHEDCRVSMIKEGVLYALVKLARLESLEIRTLCVTVMYNLSCDDGLLPILKEINVAQVIAKMCESDINSDENRQKMAACLTNMTLIQGYEVRLVESDVLNAILLLCEQGGLNCLRNGASVLCSLSSQRECCEPMATLAITELLIKMISSKDGQQCLFALSALCNLSCAPGAHEKLDEAETIAAVLRVVSESEEELILLTGVKFLHNLSSNVRYHVHLIKHQFIPIILHVFSDEVFESVADVSAGIIATLSEDQTILNQLVNEGAVKVLRMAAASDRADTIGNCIISLCRLARGGHSGARMLEDGLFDILAAAIPAHLSVVMSERVALILRTLSTYMMCLPHMVGDTRLIPIVTAITQAGDRDTCRHCVMLLHNITAARNHDFQSKAKASGVVPLLIQLSQVGASDIRQVSSVALAHINSELSEFDQSDNYEAGLVSTLITMLDMDTTMMQKVEKIAMGIPPPLKLEPRKIWNFMSGFRSTRVLHQIPVIWSSQNTPVDERNLVPSEPRTYLSEFPHQSTERTGTIKDFVYGTCSVMRVNGDKCRVKPTPRGIPLSPTSIIKKLHESSPEEVPEIAKENSPRTAVATVPPKQPKTKSTPRQRSYMTQGSQRPSLPNVLLKRGSSVNLPKL